MTGKAIDEVHKFKIKVEDLFKDYENRVKNSLNNFENSQSKNKIMNDSVRIFFSSVQNAINDLEKKISNWKFNIQRNIGGIEYAIKNN